jgi:hypothetical protein
MAQTEDKDFYAAGIDALVKRCYKRINVGGGYVEYHMFYVLYPFVTYLLTLPRILEYSQQCFSGKKTAFPPYLQSFPC